MKKILFCIFLISACSHNNISPSTITKPEWSLDIARKFVNLSLECVDKEFPNHWERLNVKQKPSELHAAFFGCYDWHSAVHGHWAMVRILRLFPQIPERDQIIKKLNNHLSQSNLEKELNFFNHPPKFVNRFEEPYGYGWYLRLAEELEDHPLQQSKIWRKNLIPLENLIVSRLYEYFKRIPKPNRYGAHDNSAYAMMHSLAYAEKTKNKKLRQAIEEAALSYYEKDESCPFAYEPASTDFVSPCLIEAELMSKLLKKSSRKAWLEKFLGKISPRSSFFTPVIPTDPKDPYLGHNIGLMFQKAASLTYLANELPELKNTFLESAKTHSDKGIQLMFDSGYGGAHWLASFAIFHFSSANL